MVHSLLQCLLELAKDLAEKKFIGRGDEPVGSVVHYKKRFNDFLKQVNSKIKEYESSPAKWSAVIGVVGSIMTFGCILLSWCAAAPITVIALAGTVPGAITYYAARKYYKHAWKQIDTCKSEAEKESNSLKRSIPM